MVSVPASGRGLLGRTSRTAATCIAPSRGLVRTGRQLRHSSSVPPSQEQATRGGTASSSLPWLVGIGLGAAGFAAGFAFRTDPAPGTPPALTKVHFATQERMIRV